jgi:hypothetical protein
MFRRTRAMTAGPIRLGPRTRAGDSVRGEGLARRDVVTVWNPVLSVGWAAHMLEPKVRCDCRASAWRSDPLLRRDRIFV